MDLSKELREIEEMRRLARKPQTYLASDEDEIEVEERPNAFNAPKIEVNLGVKKTKDYEQFKLIKRNRKIKKVHLERMKNSLKENNRLEWSPILVNEQMEVLDGQHRLAAAKELGLEVCYQQVKGERPNDIITLQTAMMWNLEDHFHSWCEAGTPDYLKLKNFMQKHHLDLSRALCLFGEYKSKTFYESFRNGKFQFNVLFEKLDENVKNIKTIIDFVNMKTAGSKRYLKSTNFWCALSTFLNTKEVDFETFMGKLEYKLDLMRPATKIQEYNMIFKTIYNWKNKAPIE